MIVRIRMQTVRLFFFFLSSICKQMHASIGQENHNFIKLIYLHSSDFLWFHSLSLSISVFVAPNYLYGISHLWRILFFLSVSSLLMLYSPCIFFHTCAVLHVVSFVVIFLVLLTIPMVLLFGYTVVSYNEFAILVCFIIKEV